METASKFLQLIIATLGITSQLVLLHRELSKKRAERPPEVIAPGAPASVTSAQFPPSRSLLDLSFVLLCAAFFALLLSHSFVISGRSASGELENILKVLLITLAVGGTMVGAWLKNLSDVVTGVLAVTTLLVLLIAPGGPFLSLSLLSAGTEAGLEGRWLFVVVASLVILASTMLINNIGNPLSNTLDRRKRMTITAIMAALIVLASLALGSGYAVGVAKDSKTPKIEQTQTRQLLNNVMAWEPKDRRTFYRLASELLLAAYYQTQYLDKKTQYQAPAPVTDSSQSNREEEAPQAQERAAYLYRLIDSFKLRGNLADQEKYLYQRLAYIHPTGQDNQIQASIQLPGITPLQRFNTTGNYRITYALYNQKNFGLGLFSIFKFYSPEVQNVVKELKDAGDEKKGLTLKEFVTGKKSSEADKLYKPTLFPDLGSASYGERLTDQLSLPLIEELYVAYSEYKDLAPLLIKRDLKDKYKGKEEEIINGFNSLGDEMQKAFLFYLYLARSPERVYRMLAALADMEDKLRAFTEESRQATAGDDLLVALQDDISNPKTRIQQLAQDIKQDKESANTLLDLLRRQDSDVKVRLLFDPKVLGFVRSIKGALEESDRDGFFQSVADPVWTVLRSIAKSALPQSSAPEKDGIKLLQDFRDLPNQEERDGLLLQLAIDIYQTGGDYSLNPISRKVAQLSAWRWWAGLIFAAILFFPLLLLCLAAGGFCARMLVARNRMREMMANEQADVTQVEDTLVAPVEMCGRAETLRNLRSLAERGWSTIGVVGRRGVGKSRLLQALLQSDRDDPEAPTIKVWVASPASFREEDFIASILERLALSVEATIASFLDAKPLFTRRIESRAALVALGIYGAAFLLLCLVTNAMYDKLSQPDVVITWLPILIVVLGSLGLLIYYLSKLQPVDLSFWLQRDRSHNAQTVMLYREVYEVLQFLRARARASLAWGSSRKLSLVRIFIMIALGATFILSLPFTLVYLIDPSDTMTTLILLAVTLLSLFGLVLLYNQTGSGERVAHYGQSVMSLIAAYRSFASLIVHRLKQGALGHPAKRKFTVLICIDELDKIVVIDEIRDFMRRIKAIFEVPGVYYYVSLAEDALTKLVLGTATGKDEIDSSFDHIVRIPPVICDVGEKIATSYLENHGFSGAEPRLARAIAAISFGVPRDIIRRCDEIIARDGHQNVKPVHLVADLRRLQARIGYELQQLSRSQMAALSQGPAQSAVNAQDLLNNGLPGEAAQATQRLALAVWLYSLVELTVESADDTQWRQISKEICEIGYKLPIGLAADLRQEIDQLHLSVTVNNPTVLS